MCSRKKVIFIINNIFYSLIKISKSFKNENLINKNDFIIKKSQKKQKQQFNNKKRFY